MWGISLILIFDVSISSKTRIHQQLSDWNERQKSHRTQFLFVSQLGKLIIIFKNDILQKTIFFCFERQLNGSTRQRCSLFTFYFLTCHFIASCNDANRLHVINTHLNILLHLLPFPRKKSRCHYPHYECHIH